MRLMESWQRMAALTCKSAYDRLCADFLSNNPKSQSSSIIDFAVIKHCLRKYVHQNSCCCCFSGIPNCNIHKFPFACHHKDGYGSDKAIAGAGGIGWPDASLLFFRHMVKMNVSSPRQDDFTLQDTQVSFSYVEV